jgi:hypothetical protein
VIGAWAFSRTTPLFLGSSAVLDLEMSIRQMSSPVRSRVKFLRRHKTTVTQFVLVLTYIVGTGSFAGAAGTIDPCEVQSDPLIIRWDICPSGVKPPPCEIIMDPTESPTLAPVESETTTMSPSDTKNDSDDSDGAFSQPSVAGWMMARLVILAAANIGWL